MLRVLRQGEAWPKSGGCEKAIYMRSKWKFDLVWMVWVGGFRWIRRL